MESGTPAARRDRRTDRRGSRALPRARPHPRRGARGRSVLGRSFVAPLTGSTARRSGSETWRMAPARPPLVSQAEWDAALEAITEQEKLVADAMHDLAATRKRMPMVRVERDYEFEGPNGRRSLSGLFDDRHQ